MEIMFFYALISVFVVSLISFIGVLSLSVKYEKLEKILIYMISFSAGALFGDAFIHLLPEVYEGAETSAILPLFIISGIAFSFIAEKIFQWRHCHHPTSKDHPHPFAYMNLFGDIIHNFLDGLIIGAAYLLDIKVGIATTVAVLLHEIPQEIGDFSVLLYGGFSRKKALIMNFLVSLTAVIGVLLAFVLSRYVENCAYFLAPFAAGNFIYIAGSDLIPELHKKVDLKSSILQLIMFVVGVFVMFALLGLE